QSGTGFSASIDIEDSGNGQNNPLGAAGATSVGTPGTGRGKVVINTSIPSTLGSAGNGTALTNDALRLMQPDLAGNLRVDQAWGSAQIMAALHNASAGYYTNFPGLTSATVGAVPGGVQVFGHPAEAWGYAVGGGAKLVNFLLPRDMIEFQANYCHGAIAYCLIPGLYTQNWMYGNPNTLAAGYSVDGVF